MPNILGIDYGKKRIGLAFVPDGIEVVLAFGIVEAGENAAEEIQSIIVEERIEHVVCGLPLSLNGEEGDWAKEVKETVESIVGETGVPVTFMDERYTTTAAQKYTDADASKDEIAAMIILDTYLEQQKNS